MKKKVNKLLINKDKIKKFIKENISYVLTIIVIIILFNIKLPYYILAPGGTIDISDRIEYIEKEKNDGSLNMLYVTQYEANVPTFLLSFIFRNWDLEDMEMSQISNETMDEIEIRNKIMLDNSINNAKYVAYNAANKDITISSQKNYIIGTLVSTNLKIGDEVLAINDTIVDDLPQIKNIITEHEIGDKLTFKIIRDKKEITVEEEVKEIEGMKAIGVIFITDYEYKLKPEIELKFKKSESGSSGGLMMALSIYNAITDEDILKGRKIAGTGTIDNYGNVGEIGGIKYKIMGAARKGMDVVLVPSANYKEAIKTKKDNKYDLEIVEIKTFMDAINYLKG